MSADLHNLQTRKNVGKARDLLHSLVPRAQCFCFYDVDHRCVWSSDGADDYETDNFVADLPEAVTRQVIRSLSEQDKERLQAVLAYPEDSAGRRMQTEFVAVPPYWSVGQTIDYLRDSEDLPDSFAQIFVIDPTFHLVGAVVHAGSVGLRDVELAACCGVRAGDEHGHVQRGVRLRLAERHRGWCGPWDRHGPGA